MGRENTAGAGTQIPAELWGGLELDLERLQGLLDGAVEQMQAAFVRINDAAASPSCPEELRTQIQEDARRVVTCLQFHDIASQMIASLRSRSALLELAALTVAPNAASAEHARLLDEALRLARSRPGNARVDRSGEVDLF